MSGGRGYWRGVQGAVDTYRKRLAKFIGSKVTELGLQELPCAGLLAYCRLLMFCDI